MKIKIPTLFPFLIISLSCMAQTSEQISQADIIISDINVLSMLRPEVQEHQMVCISKGKITFVGTDNSTKELKTNAKIISGKGQYLIPGMADMHCHFPEKKEIKKYFTLNLMAGVTTLRSMQGNSEHLNYRNSDSLHPNLYLSAPPVFAKTNITNEVGDSLMKKYKADGFDFVKVMSIKDTVSFASLMSSAKKYNMPVCGHMPKNISLDYILQSGYNSIEHLGGQVSAYDKGVDNFQRILSLTKKNGVYHCPTLDWYQIAYSQVPEQDLKKRIGLEYIPDSVKQKWSKQMADDAKETNAEIIKQKADYKLTQEKQFKILKLIADNNVGLLIGLDAGGLYSVPGFDMIEEMKLYKKAGLSNYQILQAATINAAKYLKQDKEWGTVETGKDANLILLSENPLINIEAITKIEGVFLNAKYFIPKELGKTLY